MTRSATTTKKCLFMQAPLRIHDRAVSIDREVRCQQRNPLTPHAWRREVLGIDASDEGLVRDMYEQVVKGHRHSDALRRYEAAATSVTAATVVPAASAQWLPWAGFADQLHATFPYVDTTFSSFCRDLGHTIDEMLRSAVDTFFERDANGEFATASYRIESVGPGPVMRIDVQVAPPKSSQRDQQYSRFLDWVYRLHGIEITQAPSNSDGTGTNDGDNAFLHLQFRHLYWTYNKRPFNA